ncbi:MAG: phosphoribosylformylglycinamidine synthase subunit PurS [Candidatus Methanomethylophilaceae archaeon]|nr:phosphoribosylformylglycinamidine synthase subunit PurS [Candidatus Methanomethylophilaceae archaeon]
MWKIQACLSESFNYARVIHSIMAVIDIRIELKKGVADPEGTNTKKTLESLGFNGIENVKTVKFFEVTLDMPADEAKKHGEEMCKKLLANPVIQTYSVTVR